MEIFNSERFMQAHIIKTLDSIPYKHHLLVIIATIFCFIPMRSLFLQGYMDISALFAVISLSLITGYFRISIAPKFMRSLIRIIMIFFHHIWSNPFLFKDFYNLDKRTIVQYKLVVDSVCLEYKNGVIHEDKKLRGTYEISVG